MTDFVVHSTEAMITLRFRWFGFVSSSTFSPFPLPWMIKRNEQEIESTAMRAHTRIACTSHGPMKLWSRCISSPQLKDWFDRFQLLNACSHNLFTNTCRGRLEYLLLTERSIYLRVLRIDAVETSRYMKNGRQHHGPNSIYVALIFLLRLLYIIATTPLHTILFQQNATTASIQRATQRHRF